MPLQGRKYQSRYIKGPEWCGRVKGCCIFAQKKKDQESHCTASHCLLKEIVSEL
jgi:hypothetical protein